MILKFFIFLLISVFISIFFSISFNSLTGHHKYFTLTDFHQEVVFIQYFYHQEFMFLCVLKLFRLLQD